MTGTSTKHPTTPKDEFRAVLSLREAAVLAEIPEPRVRKDIETGVLRPLKPLSLDRLCFRWPDVFILAAIYRNQHLTGKLRRRAFEKLESLVEPSYQCDLITHAANKGIQSKPSRSIKWREHMKIDEYLFIETGKLWRDLTPRVDTYAAGLSRIEEREGVLGGEAVFKNTRLAVDHVGKMYRQGETMKNILEDYPYLDEDDVKFAGLYHDAHPTIGRPRASRGAADANSAS